MKMNLVVLRVEKVGSSALCHRLSFIMSLIKCTGSSYETYNIEVSNIPLYSGHAAGIGSDPGSKNKLPTYPVFRATEEGTDCP